MYKICCNLISWIFLLILLSNLFPVNWCLYQMLLLKFISYYCLHYIIPRILHIISRKCWYSMQTNLWWWAIPKISRAFNFVILLKSRKSDACEIYSFYSNQILLFIIHTAIFYSNKKCCRSSGHNANTNAAHLQLQLVQSCPVFFKRRLKQQHLYFLVNKYSLQLISL